MVLLSALPVLFTLRARKKVEPNFLYVYTNLAVKANYDAASDKSVQDDHC